MKPHHTPLENLEHALACFTGDRTSYLFEAAKELLAWAKKIQEERDRVASGKLNCADCGAILARW